MHIIIWSKKFPNRVVYRLLASQKLDFHDFYKMNNSTIEHDTMKLITSFHSESTAHYNDINISYYEKIPKIGKNPLIIDLAFHPNLTIFAMCSKH